MGSIGDIRFALRTLVRNRGFTAMAVLCLALGIGASSAIFTIVDRTMLRPLPYRDPASLVAINTRFEALKLPHYDLSLLEVKDLRERSKALTDISAYGVIDGNVSFHVGAAPQRVICVIFDPNTLTTLGVKPALGRDFRPEEGVVGNELVVLLSDDVWRRVYHADPDVIGRTVVIDTEPHVVIGVMPAGFRFPLRPDVGIFAPLAFRPDLDSERAKRTYGVLGRMAPGIDIDDLDAELAGIAGHMGVEHPHYYPDALGFGLTATRLDDVLFGSMRPSMIALLFAVALVLLIACANVAGLLLARGVTRERELALRATLGASRWRLMRQLITESLVLAALGAAAGLLGALWGTDLLISLYPDSLPHLAAVSVDRTVLGFTIVISVVAGLVAGLMPAIQSSKVDLHSALKDGGLRATASKRRRRLRSSLVAAEIALALVLLVGAGLMLRTLRAMQSADLGFRNHNLTTMKFKLPWTDYMKPEVRQRIFTQLLDRVAALPEARGVALASRAPLERHIEYVSARLTCPSCDRLKHPPAIQVSMVSPGYFELLGIDVLAGREFGPGDDDYDKPVAIIDEVFASYLPDGIAPTSAKVSFASKNDKGSSKDQAPVIGVVRHVKHDGVSSQEYPQLYLPILSKGSLQATMLIDSNTCVEGMAAAVQRELNVLDSRIPIYEAETMSDRVAASVALHRFASLLLGLFAALALLLASVGVYAVMSYSVTQRRREIGIRLALGARPRQVLGMILGQGAGVTLIGLALGLIAAAGFGLASRSLLYGTSPIDPVIYIIATLTVAGAALFACYLAARRATRVDPMDALRQD